MGKTRIERSSCRIHRDVSDRLQKVGDVDGNSLADVLKIGLDILYVKVSGKQRSGRTAIRERMPRLRGLYKITYLRMVWQVACGEQHGGGGH